MKGWRSGCLAEKQLPPGQRPILSSYETFRKHSLISDAQGNVTEVAFQGVACAFATPNVADEAVPGE